MAHIAADIDGELRLASQERACGLDFLGDGEGAKALSLQPRGFALNAAQEIEP